MADPSGSEGHVGYICLYNEVDVAPAAHVTQDKRIHTFRQTDRQVLTLDCEFDLGCERFGSHPIGSLTPVHRQTDRYLHWTVSLTWVIRGLGVTMLEASHL